MPHAGRTLAALTVLVLLTAAGPVGAEPLFTLADEGRTFLYRSRPGDLPATVAEMFGVRPQGLPAFLAANGITDPTRVSAGFVYRIPNTAVQAMVERTAALDTDNARLKRMLGEAEEQARKLARDAEDTKARAVNAEARAARADRLERLWPMGQAVIALLVLVAAITVAIAVAALRRQHQAERFARSLGEDLEAKRKGSLLERQESTRRTLEFEARIRSLEVQLGPRVLFGGRSS